MGPSGIGCLEVPGQRWSANPIMHGLFSESTRQRGHGIAPAVLTAVQGFVLDRLYDQLAWAYDGISWLVSLGRWSAWRQAALHYVQGTRLLEIGCGTGRLLTPLAQRGRWVCGGDLSRPMLRQSRRRAGRSAALCQLRAQALPFAAATFDAVICTFPSDYIRHRETWAEFERVLRRGGRVVVVYGVSVGRRTLAQRVVRVLLTLGRTSGATLRPGWANCGGLSVRHHVVDAGRDDRVGLLIAERFDAADHG